ncbi:unnamed protein product [Pieris macdunnoughi]|uniref:Uncharacterized protein n=1 Tax=Pieris macdunnoughi TaxID=345717 RepID=A0A821UAD3_9NEOP|nr:unnamed protein product [Pieris macdunnoughi]
MRMAARSRTFAEANKLCERVPRRASYSHTFKDPEDAVQLPCRVLIVQVAREVTVATGGADKRGGEALGLSARDVEAVRAKPNRNLPPAKQTTFTLLCEDILETVLECEIL